MKRKELVIQVPNYLLKYRYKQHMQKKRLDTRSTHPRKTFSTDDQKKFVATKLNEDYS